MHWVEVCEASGCAAAAVLSPDAAQHPQREASSLTQQALGLGAGEHKAGAGLPGPSNTRGLGLPEVAQFPNLGRPIKSMNPGKPGWLRS